MIVFINYYFVIFLLRFYQLLALYIFFLITLSVAVLLRPLGVSSNQFCYICLFNFVERVKSPLHYLTFCRFSISTIIFISIFMALPERLSQRLVI